MIKLTLIDYFYKMTKLSSLYCNKKKDNIQFKNFAKSNIYINALKVRSYNQYKKMLFPSIASSKDDS